MEDLNKIYSDFKLKFSRTYLEQYAYLRYSELEERFKRSDMSLDRVLDSIIDVIQVRLWNSLSRQSVESILFKTGSQFESLDELEKDFYASLELDKEEYKVSFISLIGNNKDIPELDQSEVREWGYEILREWREREEGS